MFSKKNIIIFGVGDRVLQVIKILIKKNINISAVVPRLNIRKSKKFIMVKANLSSEIYDDLQYHTKRNDKKYITVLF